MHEPLKNCPFCGGINIIHCGHHMYCHACGADGPDADSQHESEARSAWNRRTPQPVVREPLTADDLRMPKDGQQWRVEWWNESCRMLLPANKKLDGFQAYKTGTLMFTIKERGITQKGGSNAE